MIGGVGGTGGVPGVPGPSSPCENQRWCESVRGVLMNIVSSEKRELSAVGPGKDRIESVSVGESGMSGGA